jgi:ribosome modulation factor
MARLNITLPDVLYARLEQLRDRINLSKVCATALEKEVMMLEGQPPITDPRIAQLLQRLQSTRERWHQRGYEDGIGWAVDLATRDELQSVATHLAEQDGRQLAEFFQMRDKLTVTTQFAPPPSPPHVLHLQRPIEAGQTASGIVLHPPIPPAPAMSAMPPAAENVFYHHHRVGIPFPGFPESFHPAQRLQYWQSQDRERSGEAPQGQATRIEVDERAYLEGWRDAVKGIWQTIAPALS